MLERKLWTTMSWDQLLSEYELTLIDEGRLEEARQLGKYIDAVTKVRQASALMQIATRFGHVGDDLGRALSSAKTVLDRLDRKLI